MFCTNCGKTLKDGATFCTGCGKEVKKNAAMQSEPTQSPDLSMNIELANETSIEQPPSVAASSQTSTLADDIARVALRSETSGGKVLVTETYGDMHILLKQQPRFLELIVNGKVVNESQKLNNYRMHARIGNAHIESTVQEGERSLKIYENGELKANFVSRTIPKTNIVLYGLASVILLFIGFFLLLQVHPHSIDFIPKVDFLSSVFSPFMLHTVATLCFAISLGLFITLASHTRKPVSVCCLFGVLISFLFLIACFITIFTDDIPNNNGTLTFANAVYIGDVVDGMKHGHGTLTFANGNVYTGDFVDGYRHGHGTFTFANGDVYIGDFVDGYRHGHGTLTFANGTVYTGDFVDGMMHGHGTMTRANGDVYTGDFVDGYRHGHGTMTWANGDVYTGDFVDGMMHGHGTMTRANGDVYTGEWVEGRRHLQAP